MFYFCIRYNSLDLIYSNLMFTTKKSLNFDWAHTGMQHLRGPVNEQKLIFRVMYIIKWCQTYRFALCLPFSNQEGICHVVYLTAQHWPFYLFSAEYQHSWIFYHSTSLLCKLAFTPTTQMMWVWSEYGVLLKPSSFFIESQDCKTFVIARAPLFQAL